MPRARKNPVPTPGAPRDPRGGPRQGTPGRTYPNRSDLARQPMKAAPGQEYGRAAQQMAAQQAVPLAGPAMIYPEDTPTLGTPTARPDEPVTAGLPFGPGRTPTPNDTARSDVVTDDMTDRLRAFFALHPTAALRELLEQAD